MLHLLRKAHAQENVIKTTVGTLGKVPFNCSKVNRTVLRKSQACIGRSEGDGHGGVYGWKSLTRLRCLPALMPSAEYVNETWGRSNW